ncbi:chemotaxis protein CheC [Paenibacillus antri]|uniref:Chemotaxis protein CheC n=1 Tax=Paenibacillus antri TaxID=2582848 RepID=A0A5R9GA56_9BACL|nr:chemotaxis protein CheC [Paenibacillus antri]TLS49964.1 chemotaxis protein CheC [Paenibacillus antri]
MDVLREVGNIGAGHAATALSKLLGKPVDMDVPRVNLVPFDDIAEQVGGAEAVVAAVFLRVEGDAPGNLFFLLSIDSAKQLLLELVAMETGEGAPFTELEVSALSEIGNILAGSYLSSLADLTRLNLSPTVPGFAVDMAGAILAYGLLQFGDMGDKALLIETSFFDGFDRVEGNLFLIPDPDAFATIFASLGVPPE